MKLAVIGSRSITDPRITYRALDEWRTKYHVAGTPLTLLAGGATGVDASAQGWASANQLDFVLFKPYFMLDKDAKYDVRHYFIRNKQLVLNADHVLAIWDGHSNGTDFGIKYAKKKRKPLTIVVPAGINKKN